MDFNCENPDQVTYVCESIVYIVTAEKATQLKQLQL